MEQRSREQGFTIVELMVVVAIVAVLAAIVIPNFMTQSKKSKARSEVGAMFAELAIREEQYKTENNAYLEAPGCPAGTPSSVSRDTQSCLASGQPWDLLRVKVAGGAKTASATSASAYVYCTYEVTTNTSSSPTPPAWVTTQMWTAPAVSWFFIVATCDMDGNGVTSQYFTSSVSSQIYPHNDGN